MVALEEEPKEEASLPDSPGRRRRSRPASPGRKLNPTENLNPHGGELKPGTAMTMTVSMQHIEEIEEEIRNNWAGEN